VSDALARAWGRLRPRRPHGIAAALLPYGPSGGIDWAAFERHLVRIRDAGLDPAVNLDTGFGDWLTPPEREAALDVARAALGPEARIYAGVWADAAPSPEEGYARALAAVERRGAIGVIVQCPAMQGMAPQEKQRLYAAIAARAERGVLGFELSTRFAPHGEIWDEETFARLLDVAGLLGAKHSSLDRATELARLAARDARRPEFRIYTGNDLAIDMVAYGSDYLLGLATFAPAAFAERDAALAAGDAAFLGRNDALQHLGNVAFREPVPAYKHSAALFLHLVGELECAEVHPRAPRRPPADRLLLLDCAVRLGLVADPDRARRERVAPYL
jgi:dihydrodipicolinate synthase/N-acetylneuraminate lyase